ncbi:MAG: hypothetical protein FJX70_07210 [Alphaproteobacteria bacterium]|nr:hypothetical protein [Alphaproteobacteria bacterium]
MKIEESDFADHFTRLYVHVIKRGIEELRYKEEYKNGFRISYIPLGDTIKQMIIENKTFVKDLCKKAAPKLFPYLCEIIIENKNEDDLEDLKITTIYFLKYECKPPLVTAEPIDLFMMRIR